MLRLSLLLAGCTLAAAGEYFGEDSGNVELLTTEDFEEKVLESSCARPRLRLRFDTTGRSRSSPPRPPSRSALGPLNPLRHRGAGTSGSSSSTRHGVATARSWRQSGWMRRSA